MTVAVAVAHHTLPLALLHAAATICHEEKTRYAMNSVEIRRIGGETLITATDGKMLIRFPSKDVEGGDDNTVLVPAEALLEMAKRVKKIKPFTPENIRITVGADLTLSLVAVNVDHEPIGDQMSSPIGEGHFPPCDDVEAPASGIHLAINAGLLASLAQAFALANGTKKRGAGPVRLWVRPEDDGKVRKGIRVEVSGLDNPNARATLMPLNI